MHSTDNVACAAITVHKMLLKQLFAALIPNMLLLFYKVFIPPHFDYTSSHLIPQTEALDEVQMIILRNKCSKTSFILLNLSMDPWKSKPTVFGQV